MSLRGVNVVNDVAIRNGYAITHLYNAVCLLPQDSYVGQSSPLNDNEVRRKMVHTHTNTQKMQSVFIGELL